MGRVVDATTLPTACGKIYNSSQACGKRCGNSSHRPVGRDVETMDTLDDFPHLNLFWVEAVQGYFT
jgi:hypothetical protein